MLLEQIAIYIIIKEKEPSPKIRDDSCFIFLLNIKWLFYFLSALLTTYLKKKLKQGGELGGGMEKSQGWVCEEWVEVALSGQETEGGTVHFGAVEVKP